MKRGFYILLYISFVYAGLSCNSPNGPVAVNTQTIDTTPLDSLDFQQTSYNSILIKNNNTITMNPEYLNGIYIGSYDNGMFTTQDTIKPIFDGYKLNLNYKMSFLDTQLVADVGVKFVFSNGTDHVVHKTINLFQFTYPSTKILLRWDEFILPNILGFAIQDFIYLQPHIYYHPLGPLGLYDYNMTTKETRLLFDYGSGISVGANSQYIFDDYGHHYIYRYNFSKDTVDNEFDLASLSNWSSSNSILGIACSDSLVYVSTGIVTNKLYILTVDLKFISSIDINFETFSMAYYDNFLYAGDFYNNIRKINPATGAVIDIENNLSIDVEGISIYGDNLYFSDYTRKYIGYIPIKDLFPN